MQSRDDWEDDFQEAYAKLAYKHQLPETIPADVMEWAQSEPLGTKDAKTVAAMAASVMCYRHRKPKTFKKKTAQESYRELLEAANKTFATCSIEVPQYVADTIRKEGYTIMYQPGHSLEVTSRFSKIGVKVKLKWPESIRKKAERARKAVVLDYGQILQVLARFIDADTIAKLETLSAYRSSEPFRMLSGGTEPVPENFMELEPPGTMFDNTKPLSGVSIELHPELRN